LNFQPIGIADHGHNNVWRSLVRQNHDMRITFIGTVACSLRNASGAPFAAGATTTL
jgi:hypothetical protein